MMIGLQYFGLVMSFVVYMAFIGLPSSQFILQLFGDPNYPSLLFSISIVLWFLINSFGVYVTHKIYFKIYSYFEK